jgi:RNA polymerase sigma-70 factor (ECF subfamily)
MSQVLRVEQDNEFMDLFVANQAVIYAFVRSFVPNYSDADELFQQVAMTMWRRRDTFDPALGSYRAWAIGIARNHLRNFDRRQYRDLRVQIFAPDVLDRIVEGWQEMDDTWTERQKALRQCIGKLEPSDRKKLEHYYSRSIGAKEMADAEGVSLRTFYRKLEKLRRFLLGCISKSMEAEGGVHGQC